MPRNTSGLKRGGGPGRKKGVPNKVNGAFKQALLEAFHQIGGAPALAEWGQAEKNRGAFYQICGRLIPTEVVGPGDDQAIVTKVVHEYRDKP